MVWNGERSITLGIPKLCIRKDFLQGCLDVCIVVFGTVAAECIEATCLVVDRPCAFARQDVREFPIGSMFGQPCFTEGLHGGEVFGSYFHGLSLWLVGSACGLLVIPRVCW
jgi:hypothetical protein